MRVGVLEVEAGAALLGIGCLEALERAKVWWVSSQGNLGQKW